MLQRLSVIDVNRVRAVMPELHDRRNCLPPGYNRENRSVCGGGHLLRLSQELQGDGVNRITNTLGQDCYPAPAALVDLGDGFLLYKGKNTIGVSLKTQAAHSAAGIYV